MEFNEKVKNARKRLKMSQEKFAREMSVSFATINRWESGKSFPSYEKEKFFSKYCSDKNIIFGEKNEQE